MKAQGGSEEEGRKAGIHNGLGKLLYPILAIAISEVK